MRETNEQKPRDDKVGYGRPPKTTQFRAGQSGNPKGRPKGSRSIGQVVNDVIGQRIVVTENGRKRRVPALEVIMRRLVNDAMRADPRAIKVLLSLVDRYADAGPSAVDVGAMLAEDKLILSRYLPEALNGQPAESERADPLERTEDDGGG